MEKKNHFVDDMMMAEASLFFENQYPDIIDIVKGDEKLAHVCRTFFMAGYIRGKDDR